MSSVPSTPGRTPQKVLESSDFLWWCCRWREQGWTSLCSGGGVRGQLYALTLSACNIRYQTRWTFHHWCLEERHPPAYLWSTVHPRKHLVQRAHQTSSLVVLMAWSNTWINSQAVALPYCRALLLRVTWTAGFSPDDDVTSKNTATNTRMLQWI